MQYLFEYYFNFFDGVFVNINVDKITYSMYNININEYMIYFTF